MKMANFEMEDKSRQELLRENRMLWELAKLEIELKKCCNELAYHNSFSAEGFRKVMINQIQQRIDRIKVEIEGMVDLIENEEW